MGEYKDIIEEKICKEIDEIKEKLRGGGDISESDMKRLDLLYHTLKSKAGYEEKKYAEYDMGGMSYANRSGNGGYSGRYSRDMGPGASGRYSRDMGPGYSGHYPMPAMPYYYEERQW